MLTPDEVTNEMLAAESTLAMIADHALDHGAGCVTNALAFWFADLLSFLFDQEVITIETVEAIITAQEIRLLPTTNERD